jgi:S-layer family protein
MISHERTRLHRAAAVCVLLALVLLAPAARAKAQSYGLGDQVLTLGAVAFRPRDSLAQYATPNGVFYLYGQGEFAAPLTLPDGAEIFQLCLYASVEDANHPISAVIIVQKLVPGGQTPFVEEIQDSWVADTIPIGYGTVCTAPFSYVVHDLEDVDSDGSPDPIAHLVGAYVSGSSALGGVRIFWRRQISPPPDTPTFNDVPADDPAFAYVEALVASGITGGCGTNPPRYCPDAPLTRRQMAVFLSKALGLHWPN